MARPAVLAAVLVSSFAAASPACGKLPSEILPPGVTPTQRITSPVPTYVPSKPVDWRWVNGTGFTARVGYQLLPSPCGSCWAFAATGALSDRVKIAAAGRLDISLSPQSLLDCANRDQKVRAGSCNGGSPQLAYEFAAQAPGLPDETCLPYTGVDNANWGEAPCADRLCRRCDRFGTCKFLPRNETPTIRVDEHGTALGVAAMKAEIAARGPIACLMYAHADSFESYTGGVITDPTRYGGITHVVTVVGWGEDQGVEHWIVRNSFGTQWGELGYYRQEIGKDIYNMESHNCSWATPAADSVRAMMQRSGLTSSPPFPEQSIIVV